MELKYTRTVDDELPNLTLNNNEKGTINKYGMLRLDYLKLQNTTLKKYIFESNKDNAN